MITNSCESSVQAQRVLCLVCVAGSVLFAYSAGAHSQSRSDEKVVEEVITIGSRVKGRTAAESAVPVDIIKSDTLSDGGFSELGQALQTVAPSFNFSRTQISDGNDLFLPATLRGLQPDQVLVLINGKRRHTQAVFQLSNSIGGGAAGTDLNSIPITALRSVEILRDGAAAQYGSDAIAGVININLKESTGQTSGFIQYGQTGSGDGETLPLGFNTGFELGNSGGFINISAEYRDFDSTNRASPGWFQGSAEGEFASGFYNARLPLYNGALYSFGGVSDRTATGSGFRRQAGSAAQVVPQVHPDGFLPNIDNEATDVSFSLGYLVDLTSDWNMDFSVTYGENEYDFGSSNTINASIAAEYLRDNPGATDEDIAANAGPTAGHAGGRSFEQVTFNLDLVGSIEMAETTLNVALGAEARDENYQVRPGILASYSCGSQSPEDASGGIPSVVIPSDPNVPRAFAGCGFQAFSGISPAEAGEADRSSYAAYIDLESNLTDIWLLGVASRFEKYSAGVGSELTGKISTRFDFTDSFALRGAAATGFRAPSLQQAAYSAFQTNINDAGVLERSFTAAAGSAFPRALGVDGLDIETSDSVSIGFVWSPTDTLLLTVDFYRISIDDRIVLGGLINRESVADNPAALAELDARGVNGISFFSNAVNTSTEGLDVILTYGAISLFDGDLDVTFAGNLNDTNIDGFNVPAGTSIDQIYPNETRSFLTGGQPQERATLSFDWSRAAFKSVLRISYYGSTEIDFFGANHIGIPGTRPTSVVERAIPVDFSVACDVTENFTVVAGVDNVFNDRPDRLGTDEVLHVISNGGFRYPIRAVPYGYNGAFPYLKVKFNF